MVLTPPINDKRSFNSEGTGFSSFPLKRWLNVQLSKTVCVLMALLVPQAWDPGNSISQGSCVVLLLWDHRTWTSRVQPKCPLLAQAPILAHYTEATLVMCRRRRAVCQWERPWRKSLFLGGCHSVMLQNCLGLGVSWRLEQSSAITWCCRPRVNLPSLPPWEHWSRAELA